ncbi:MAG: insulinase family protein [Deltaproteobacteria bacterium]|nr:insulinase family protein [Deltaproteobacteria bacterium]
MSKTTTLTTVLSNGLTIIGEVSTMHKSAGLGFFVRTGSRDEHPEESGISHFLEHMVFKGTKRRSALDITYELGNIGAQANAFTSEESTVYYSAIIPEYFETLQDLLSDMMRPALVQEEFDTEKNVILEEIALYQDRPNFYLYENASREFFAGHPAGNSVLGSTESVSAITSEQMRGYLQRRYTTSNMVLVAAGNFNWDRFVSDAQRYTDDWRSDEVDRTLPQFSSEIISREYKRKGLNQSHLLLLGPGCSAQSQDRYALGLLAVILGDSSGSKFYWELIDKGIAEAASADSEERDECGCFAAYASMQPSQIDKVATTLRELVKRGAEFSADDLERAKTKVISRLALGSELPMGRLMSLGMEWNYRKRLHSVKEEISVIQSLTAGDLERAFEKYRIWELSEFRLMPE